EFGPNDWFVEEKYQQFLTDPASVDVSWRQYFAKSGDGGTRAGTSGVATTTRTATAPPREKARPVPAAAPRDGDGTAPRANTSRTVDTPAAPAEEAAPRSNTTVTPADVPAPPAAPD